jgi:hypothetical protein
MPRALKTLAASFALALLLAVAPAARGAAQQAGSLVVHEKFDSSAGIPVEGYVSYLVVRRARSGEVALRESSPALLNTDSVLARGRYRLRSFIRTCSGNCGFLDSPSNFCATTFRLGAGEVVKAKVLRDASHCRVTTG